MSTVAEVHHQALDRIHLFAVVEKISTAGLPDYAVNRFRLALATEYERRRRETIAYQLAAEAEGNISAADQYELRALVLEVLAKELAP